MRRIERREDEGVPDLPFTVRMELDGWRLLWARLEVDQVVPAVIADRRHDVAAAVRRRFPDTAAISKDPTVSELRRLFRAAGSDPTRYRPASEALLRRLVKGDELPEIQPLVDLNNCLSAQLAVPCCVMVEGSFGPSLVWRSGLPGESYESLRGPFRLEDKPVLADDDGPVDTPITGNVRVAVQPDTRAAWLVAYMPASELTLADGWSCLGTLCRDTGIDAELFEQKA